MAGFTEINKNGPNSIKRSSAFASDLIPGAEDHHTAKAFYETIGQVIQNISDGETEIAIVAHATVIQLLLADILSAQWQI